MIFYMKLPLPASHRETYNYLFIPASYKITIGGSLMIFVADIFLPSEEIIKVCGALYGLGWKETR